MPAHWKAHALIPYGKQILHVKFWRICLKRFSSVCKFGKTQLALQNSYSTYYTYSILYVYQIVAKSIAAFGSDSDGKDAIEEPHYKWTLCFNSEHVAVNYRVLAHLFKGCKHQWLDARTLTAIFTFSSATRTHLTCSFSALLTEAMPHLNAAPSP